MKRNDIKALHDKTPAELQQQLAELQTRLGQAKLELKVGKLEDVRLPSKLRDDIARVKTVLRQQELVAQAQKPQRPAAAEPKPKSRAKLTTKLKQVRQDQ